jgi:aldehyde dehydrogenase (NAD+)
VCIAPDYVLVQRALEDRLVTALTGAIEAIYNPGGAGIRHCPEFQRIISDGHFARIRGLVDDALARGARLAYGGDSDAAERYIGPTLLTGVTDDMQIMHEEIFGPVLPVIPFDTPAEAVARIRARPKPLALYIYATERAQVDYYLRHTSAGSTAVNNAVIQAGIPTLPFGGVGHSGMGRVNGRQSFREFSNARAVVEDELQPQPQPTLSPQQLRELVDHLLCS